MKYINIDVERNKTGHWAPRIVGSSGLNIDPDVALELRIYVAQSMWGWVFDICKKHDIELRVKVL